MISQRLCAGAVALGAALAVHAAEPLPAAPDTVVVRSGELRLQALLFHPSGRGPFPAVLFNHGSGHSGGVSADGPDHRHPELLGPVFARHGYLFLYLYRRGDGMSAGQGIPSGELMDRAFASGGREARNQAQLRLLETDELEDAAAGLRYLRARPEADAARLAVVGHSFGGSLTLLLAERDPGVRAVVTFAAVGYSWDRSPELRARLSTAVERMAAVALFVAAANDHSLRPARELGAEMQRLGKVQHVIIYPPVGRTAAEGHDFIHMGIASWEPEVFAFLDRSLGRAPPSGR
jgi:carboxymethylenebutenolidase